MSQVDLQSKRREEDKPKMELVQQYAMVRGKLQPALKYVAPQPYINKYKIADTSRNDEVLTYPSN